MLPLISIVIPCRNEEKFIEKCLKSILDQDYPKEKLEVLVVDGMSVDRTREIIASYSKKHSNLKLIDNHKKITPTAINTGIQNSKGGVIIVLGAHTFVEGDFISKNIKYLQQTKADCVGGRVKAVGRGFWGKVISFIMSSPFGVGDARFRYSDREGYADTVAFGAYRREIFQKIGLFDENFRYGQDAELNFRLIKSGGKIFFTPRIESYYYVRSSLSELWCQYFRYGYSKAKLFRKHETLASVRSIVPTIFLLALFFSGVLGLFLKPFSFLFFGVCLAYLFLNIIFSFQISFKNGFKYFFPVMITFPVLHFSYGLGFLKGILDFLILKKEIKSDIGITR